MKTFICVGLAVAAASVAEGALVNRWSLSGSAGAVTNGQIYVDSISGASAVVRGTGVVATTGALTLPGGAPASNVPVSQLSGYIDLPNGLISSKTNLTVEIWGSIQSYQTFQRLLDFGRVNTAGDGLGAAGEFTGLTTNAPGAFSASDSMTLTWNRSAAGNVSQQRFEMKLNGEGNTNAVSGYYRLADTAVSTITNVEFHYVVVFQDGVGPFGTNGGRASWHRNTTNAATTECGFRLNQIEDVNNWLGRSLWGADRMANATYNEVRIYNHAFSSNEIRASFAAGPNPAGAPLASNDVVMMHHGQKVLVHVVTNDVGPVNPGSVAVVSPPLHGSAVPDAKGRVLYIHTNGTPASDSFVYRVEAFGTNAVSMATVTVSFASSLRITPRDLNVPPTPPPSSVQINVAFNNTAFTDPTCIASPPGDTQRVFICQKGGLLRVVTNLTGAGGAQTFLDLSALLTARGETIATGSEMGLLGLAFHPGYATNQQFFIFYSVTSGGLDYERVSRFTTLTNNPNLANTNSEVILLSQRDEAGNHNGGDLHFGPDGYLYVSLGDEGNQNDSFNNSQTITKDFFSGILRIDVDKRPGSLAPNHHAAIVTPTNYAIPPDNPFIGVTNFNGTNISATAVRTEFWAIGLRNPWRIAFDSLTGELWCGDVGGGVREEVDIITRGGNYGWAYREGITNGVKTPPAWFSVTNQINPVWDYGHSATPGTNEGNSITGGRVYRGTRFSQLVGKYVFADYSSGNLWTLQRNGTNAAVERIAGQSGIVCFGADPSNGDILIGNINNDRIYRLEYGNAASGYPLFLDDTALFADLNDLSPQPGVIPYDINLPFWSDNGIKRRWFAMTDATNFATWTPEGTWSNTPGMIWVKHFDFDQTPTNRVRLETRVLVRNASGGYGVSYRWNAAGTDATLVSDEGSNFAMTVTGIGFTNQQTWRIPSRAECMSCHNTPAGIALSFNTRQFNLTNSILGYTGNQIALLRDGGCFANPGAVPSPNLLPRHLRHDEYDRPIEARVRSYLEVNCAYCHRTGGTAPTAFDVRAALTLDQTGLINGNAANNGGNPTNKLIVPGSTFHSIVLNRIAASNGFTRMPPLGSSVIDTNSVELVAEWIMQSLPTRETYADWRLAQFGSTNSPAGDPTNDSDTDGHSNYLEFLLGSLPQDSNSVPMLNLALGSTNCAVLFETPGNRSVQVETSTNILDWTLWDVPGNAGLPLIGGPASINGPSTNTLQFHRLRIREN